ncbi:MAG TPA: zinc-binding dehydrogenase [Pseudonocardiaceae bacterium]|nr:zinc-binding dehydrogenase [Pseudonocardiaceae bacterium]
MRSVVIKPDRSFAIEERPDPVPGRGEAVVRVRAAGLNAADLQQARGDYPAPPGWPAEVPGLEVAGEVIAIGDGVRETALGDRVMALIGGGGHAERVVVPADLLMPVPDAVSWAQAGGFPEIFSTAWDALVSQAHLRAADRVLITGAAGGVGTAMVQVALVSGARVVASVRRPELHERVRSLASTGQILETVIPQQESEHGPYDVIVELVGGADCLDRITMLRTGGTYVIVGVQGGKSAPLPMFELMLRRATIIGTTIRGRSHAEKAVLARTIRDSVVPLLSEGQLRVPVDTTYRLDEYPAAYERLGGPGKFGKLVYLP